MAGEAEPQPGWLWNAGIGLMIVLSLLRLLLGR